MPILTESFSVPASRQTVDHLGTTSEIVRSPYVRTVLRRDSVDALERVNNALQALVNLHYIVAREEALNPQLRPVIAQIQAELARLSRLVRTLSSE